MQIHIVLLTCKSVWCVWSFSGGRGPYCFVVLYEVFSSAFQYFANKFLNAFSIIFISLTMDVILGAISASMSLSSVAVCLQWNHKWWIKTWLLLKKMCIEWVDGWMIDGVIQVQKKWSDLCTARAVDALFTFIPLFLLLYYEFLRFLKGWYALASPHRYCHQAARSTDGQSDPSIDLHVVPWAGQI